MKVPISEEKVLFCIFFLEPRGAMVGFQPQTSLFQKRGEKRIPCLQLFCTWTPKVCGMIAFLAVFNDLGLLTLSTFGV